MSFVNFKKIALERKIKALWRRADQNLPLFLSQLEDSFQSPEVKKKFQDLKKRYLDNQIAEKLLLQELTKLLEEDMNYIDKTQREQDKQLFAPPTSNPKTSRSTFRNTRLLTAEQFNLLWKFSGFDILSFLVKLKNLVKDPQSIKELDALKKAYLANKMDEKTILNRVQYILDKDMAYTDAFYHQKDRELFSPKTDKSSSLYNRRLVIANLWKRADKDPITFLDDLINDGDTLKTPEVIEKAKALRAVADKMDKKTLINKIQKLLDEDYELSEERVRREEEEEFRKALDPYYLEPQEKAVPTKEKAVPTKEKSTPTMKESTPDDYEIADIFESNNKKSSNFKNKRYIFGEEMSDADLNSIPTDPDKISDFAQKKRELANKAEEIGKILQELKQLKKQ
jgi:hypothetical protein